MNYKAIFALICANYLLLHQIDIKNIFLYSLIEDDIYINQLHEFYVRTAKICQFLRALYRHKQSLRVWYDTLLAFLKSYGISPLNVDLSVYAKLGLIIAIFLVDLLIILGSISEIKAVETTFYAHFHMSDLRLYKNYLGIIVTWNCKNQILQLSQYAYLEKILLNHQIIDCKPELISIKTQYFTFAAADY